MKKIIFSLVIITFLSAGALAQTRQASHSAALKTGIKSIDLINGLKVKVDFSPEKETLWFTGESKDLKMFITEFIPLNNPSGTGIEPGKSYRLDNMFASIEYKILEIENNRVTRIWFRVAAKTLTLPEKNWI
ncbi:MAG: hypothetical protein U5K32_07795 [Bacteroidales bacterium]|nr:hypothetical protein [Bacteroidales bacterium]